MKDQAKEILRQSLLKLRFVWYLEDSSLREIRTEGLQHFFLPERLGIPLYPEIFYITVLHNDPAQRIRIILGAADIEPRTSAPEVPVRNQLATTYLKTKHLQRL